MKFKKYKQILLPTDEESSVLAKNDKDEVYFHPIGYQKSTLGLNYKLQHLYILSDEEIKEEDWYYISGKIRKCIKIESDLYAEDGAISVEEFCTKIIASTNPELNLPFPTDEYLQEYCKNPQNEVEIEYELVHIHSAFPKELQLLVNSNNTINCRLISEDGWENTIKNFDEYCNNFPIELNITDFKDWLKNNYNPPTKK